MQRITIKILIFTLLLILPGAFAPETRAQAQGEFSILYGPSMRYDYSAEGNNNPPSYTADFSGMHQWVDGVEVIIPTSKASRIGVTYLHGGTSQFGSNYGIETVGDYQSAKLNTGFSNFMVTRYKKVSGLDLELMVNFSILRQMYSRKDFEINGETFYTVVPGAILDKDDDNEISGEGIGLGIKGQFGDELFLKYKAFSNFYLQMHDMKTDKELGEYFSYELTTGYKYNNFSFEFGYMYHYMFMHSQTNRRLYLGESAPEGAIISWSQQDMTVQGTFFKVTTFFD